MVEISRDGLIDGDSSNAAAIVIFVLYIYDVREELRAPVLGVAADLPVS